MASSLAEQVLVRLAALYEQALEAAAAGELERVQALVIEADPLLHGLPERRTAAEHDKHRRAVEVFDSLLEAVAYEREQTMRSLGRSRQGMRALAAYGHRLLGSGTRLERDG
jgi:hypothetical protein